MDYHTPEPPSAWMRGVAWAFRPVIRVMAMRDFADKARAVDAASVARSERDALAPTMPALGLINSGDVLTAQAGRAAVAVALRRFRLAHGAYPNTLDELAPTYLKTLPLDPFTARQPEYVRSGDGFELHARLPARASGNWDWKVSR